MRALSSILVLSGALVALTACAPSGPFDGIRSVQVRHIGSGGLQDKKFPPNEMQKLVNCLYQTVEVAEEQTDRELLQTTFLVVVSDKLGDRSFELYTERNLKGNKGKYYTNTCIHSLIKAAK